ncbi:YjcQ protein [Chlamydia trachomatis]|nr:YjcQ protein [Chlamydia trachomatis]
MAKDDYFVIVYQVLKYLYSQLKKGEKPKADKLTAFYYQIPDNYWGYIVVSLLNDGYLTGVNPKPTKEGLYIGDMSDVMLTPKGIQYLFDNSLFEKAKRTLKDIKDTIPFT